MSRFFAELKRRHVYRVAVAYAVTAWLLLQLAGIVLPTFGAPGWVLKVLIAVFAIFFPVALLLAWAFEVTPEGVRHTLPESEEPAPTPAQRRAGRRIDFAIIAILVAAVGILAWRLSVRPARVAQPVALSAPAAHSKTAIAVALPPPATVIPAKSIAVLPFVNESGDKDQQYFSDGLSEDLITALSQFGGLKVINRDSSFRFRNSQDDVKTIAAKLGVAHLLEGSVQRAGNEVRISAELVNASDGSTLWSQRYDRPYKDLFALQDDITKAVAAALKAKLLTQAGAVVQSDRPPSGNLAAYNAYLQGQFYVQRNTEGDLHKAIAQFAEATRLDPHYAAAYAAASEAWTRLAGYYFAVADKPHAYAQALAAANTALRLDPDLAAAHGAKADVLNNADFDWKGAQAESRMALELAPNSALAKFLSSPIHAALGNTGAAVGLVQQALKSNPLQALWNEWLAQYLGALGRLDEARAAARRGVALQPQSPLAYRELTMVEVLRGDAAAALAAAKSVSAGRNHNIALAWALQIGPDRAAADVALQTLISKNAGDSSYQIAEVYALRRDPDKMFEWLDRAWVNRDDGIQYLLYDPIILRYRNDPRFAAFCKKVGLPTTTDAVAMK